jgi:thiol-disulfide isomerase/thioredoxin/Flp pilus assembly protein TadD
MRTVLTTLLLVGAVSLAGHMPAAAGDRDAARLRALFFHRDFETGVIEGKPMLARSPKARELEAWYILNLVRAGEEKDAIGRADAMVKARPKDPWGWFALAGALSYATERPDEAVAAAEKARALQPGHPDMIWVGALALANHEKRRSEALAFIDAQRGRLKNPAEILTQKGYVLYLQSSGTPRDEAKLAAAFAAFEEARRADRANLNACYMPAMYLNSLRRSDEAYPLLKKALALAPGSTVVHQAYWRSITGSREMSADKKRQEVEADVEAFQKAYGARVDMLYAVGSISEEMKWPERQRAAEEKVLADFPDTSEAEWILVRRWRALGSTPEGIRSPEYAEILRAYIARPRHRLDNELLGEAYRNYFGVLAADKSSSGDELYRAAEGAVKYETNNPHSTWVGTALGLADRRVHLADAERIARESIEVLKKKIDGQRSIYKSAGEYDRAVGWYTAMGHDALGWVLFAEGRTADAEKELLQAFELDPQGRTNLDHLGRFYLAANNEVKAEEYFVKGLGVQALGANPCEASLRSLYEKRHGSLAGIDEYLAGLKDSDRAKRKERVLAERMGSPAEVPSFNLKTLDGKRVSLDSLKGKVVVINYWGIWCGWCVQELPDYQKLYEKYAADPGVAILTIDNDANPDDVPPWMAQKKYTFPVLIDEGYVGKAGIGTFPTTWFLDAQGRKVFEKVGWSEKLLEEFGWRIEAVRGNMR